MSERYTVTICRTSDGRKRKFTHEGLWGKSGYHMWKYGNYACDCNRSILFDDPTSECGVGKYWVTSIVDSSGNVVYSEDKP